MAKKKPPPASDQDGWEPAVIELAPEELLRQLAKIPKQLLAKAGLVEQSQGEDRTRIGRPQDSTSIDYAVMDSLIKYQHLHPAAFTQATLIKLIRYVYDQNGKPPAPSTIKARIKRLKSKHK